MLRGNVELVDRVSGEGGTRGRHSEFCSDGEDERATKERREVDERATDVNEGDIASLFPRTSVIPRLSGPRITSENW